MSADLTEYRSSPREQQRVADLMTLIPSEGAMALDVGARDGFLARLLAERYERVVALDLQRPAISHPRIDCQQGDATSMTYADNTFDVVLCAEVLEHIPSGGLQQACREMLRVARGAVVIGVPYRQDLRHGRTTCQACGRENPPWGHVNRFDEERLASLFAPYPIARVSYVGSTGAFTNALSSRLLSFAGNPFGTYEQEEGCVHCGAPLKSPPSRTPMQRVATRAAFVLDRLHGQFRAPRPNWIHIRIDKGQASRPASEPMVPV